MGLGGWGVGAGGGVYPWHKERAAGNKIRLQGFHTWKLRVNAWRGKKSQEKWKTQGNGAVNSELLVEEPKTVWKVLLTSMRQFAHMQKWSYLLGCFGKQDARLGEPLVWFSKVLLLFQTDIFFLFSFHPVMWETEDFVDNAIMCWVLSYWQKKSLKMFILVGKSYWTHSKEYYILQSHQQVIEKKSHRWINTWMKWIHLAVLKYWISCFNFESSKIPSWVFSFWKIGLYDLIICSITCENRYFLGYKKMNAANKCKSWAPAEKNYNSNEWWCYILQCLGFYDYLVS